MFRPGFVHIYSLQGYGMQDEIGGGDSSSTITAVAPRVDGDIFPSALQQRHVVFGTPPTSLSLLGMISAHP